jgi:2-polyprenyl-6-hydroxyphenyl methylase/3-demethylubiquinone-9 3-methyltransferase
MINDAPQTEFAVRPSDALWHEHGGYYRETPSQLLERPALPRLSFIRDRRLAGLFALAQVGPHSRVLEVGCGRSPWLPFLAKTMGCEVAGIDVEPFAADLAAANLRGAGVTGEIFCGDAFAPAQWPQLGESFDVVFSMGVLEHFGNPVDQIRALGAYVKPGGRLLTTVPNYQGVNSLLQRLVDRERLEMHVVYDRDRLAKVHEAAGFTTVTAGYVGFYEGFLSAPGPRASRSRRRLHGHVCRAVNRTLLGWAWLGGDRLTPELGWLAPHVFYLGRRTL